MTTFLFIGSYIKKASFGDSCCVAAALFLCSTHLNLKTTKRKNPQKSSITGPLRVLVTFLIYSLNEHCICAARLIPTKE